MPHDSGKRVARIDRREVAALPAQWTDREKGYQLRVLLRERGIDPNRLYLVSYHPRHRCWLFTQQGPEPADLPPSPGKSDDVFYRQLAAELRHTARLACAVHGGQRVRYQLPDAAQEVSPADLAKLLGAPDAGHSPVRFTREGGWQAGPSVN
jgi:hypothetical protein